MDLVLATVAKESEIGRANSGDVAGSSRSNIDQSKQRDVLDLLESKYKACIAVPREQSGQAYGPLFLLFYLVAR